MVQERRSQPCPHAHNCSLSPLGSHIDSGDKRKPTWAVASAGLLLTRTSAMSTAVDAFCHAYMAMATAGAEARSHCMSWRSPRCRAVSAGSQRRLMSSEKCCRVLPSAVLVDAPMRQRCADQTRASAAAAARPTPRDAIKWRSTSRKAEGPGGEFPELGSQRDTG